MVKIFFCLNDELLNDSILHTVTAWYRAKIFGNFPDFGGREKIHKKDVCSLYSSVYPQSVRKSVILA